MTRKDFHFDFNEDAEPVEELHRLREAVAEHFKTVEAIMEYTRTLPPAEEMIAELKMEIARRKKKQTKIRAPGANRKPSKRRRTAKSPVHA